MIQEFVSRIEGLTPSNVKQLADVYHEKAIFVHPFKTAFGRESINRQWRMTLKYCRNTRMYIQSNVCVQPEVFFLQWIHEFTVDEQQQAIEGSTTVVFSADVIIFQKDTFNLDHFYSLFNDRPHIL